MKEDQHRVFCHSSVCKEEADLLFFEEKAELDSNDPSTPEFEISPFGSTVNRKDRIFLSDISSAAEFSHSDPDNSVIKCELHELTVYNVVKDICVDEGARAVDKVSIESWTGDPARFHANLPSDQDKNHDIQEDDDSKLLSEDQSKPRDIDGDVSDECATKEKEDIEPIVPDCRKFSSEVDDSKGTAKDVSVESTHEQNSQMPSEEANTADKSAEKLPESVLISEPLHENSDKTSASNAIQVQCSNDTKCSHNARGQLPELEDRPNTEDKASNYLSIASSRSDRFADGETSFSAPGSLSALVAYSGSISLRSDSSTTSTRSFAFPVLQSEWNGSPVRMAKPQKKKGWRHSILCCRF